MRLFVAVECDNKEFFSELQKQLPVNSGKFKLTSSYHITLQFLGEVEDTKQIQNALEKIVFKPFTITFDHIGYFTPKQPRVAWVGIKNCQEMMILQQQVSGALQPLGFSQDKEFHPHVTLARIKFLSDKKGFKDKIDSINVNPKSIEVKSFVLYKSTLTPKGAEYEPLAEYKAQDL